MTLLNDAARAALTAGHLAHLVTLDPDGAPQVSIVWIGLEGEEIVSGHLFPVKKIRNVQANPRVAISLQTGGRNEMGLDHFLVVHGTARIQEGGAPELLQRLAEVYLGPGVRFPPMDGPPPGFVLRTTPTRVLGVGPWEA
ncbi:MAG: PPOX class F420-dependent oxidoreductase [Acidimicrobiales bacterium]